MIAFDSFGNTDLPHRLTADGDEHLISGDKLSVELNGDVRERRALPLSLIPPKHAEVFVHRTVVAEPVENPQEPLG